MPRSVNAVASRKRRKNSKAAKVILAEDPKIYTVAKMPSIKRTVYAFRDRRNKKEHSRRLWIARINAASRMEGVLQD